MVNSKSRRIVPVILAGGSGTRLWPLSRSGYPKQFQALHGERTMLQQTVERLSGLAVEKPVTICSEQHRFFVAEQLRQIDSSGLIILEPVARNTAPAIALAALLEEDPSTLLLVLSADHVIRDEDEFTKAVSNAISLAERGKLAIFGVVPDEPNTGYGYIQAGDADGHGFAVTSFVEKPDVDTAERFISKGNFYWNSGMFLFQAGRYIEELKKYQIDIYEACLLSITAKTNDLDFLRVGTKEFWGCPEDSIDYAVMEKTVDAVVVPIDAGWNDIGSWSSLWAISDKDYDGNVGIGDVLLLKCKNNYVRAEDKLVTMVGVDDLVVVTTKDAVMVADKNSVHDVKEIVQQLKLANRSELELHREVYRPWGKYDSVDAGNGYQIKRITVNPGAKLSVQMHNHRAEHWIVVSGIARVTNGDQNFLLLANQSTYIPIGEVHALENPGELPLEIVEVQTGSYLGEDDIVRFEDRYGRV